jgi:hypothetical protein
VGTEQEALVRILGKAPKGKLGETYTYSTGGATLPGIAGFVFPEGTITATERPHMEQLMQIQEVLGDKHFTDLGLLRWRQVGDELNIESSGRLTKKQESLLRRFLSTYRPRVVYIDVTKGGDIIRSTELVNPTPGQVISFIRSSKYTEVITHLRGQSGR